MSYNSFSFLRDSRFRYSNASYHLHHGGKDTTMLESNGFMDSPPISGPLGRDSPSQSIYYGQSRRSSLASLSESEVISQHPSFIKDTSKYWYKPNISREDGKLSNVSKSANFMRLSQRST